MDAKFEMVGYELGALFVLHRMNGIRTSPHWHRELELIYVLKGRIEAEVQDKSTTVQENQLLIINHEQVHTVNSREGTDTDLIILQISEQLLKSLDQTSASIHIQTLIDFNDEEDSREPPLESVHQCMSELVYEIEKPDTKKIKTFNMLCYRLITLLLQNFCTQRDDMPDLKNNRYRQRVKQILDYVSVNYMHGISQEEVALHLGIHPTYLSRIFAAYTNTSFVQFLNAYRLEKVCMELAQTADSVTEIYLRNGFTNGKTFNRVFHNQVGVTPSEFRSKQAVEGGGCSVADGRVTTSVGTYINFKENADKERLGTERQSFVLTKPVASQETSGYTETRVVLAKCGARSTVLKKPFLNLIGTGRAYDLLSAPWRKHFEMCQKELAFRYLRFHGLFNDEMGIIHKTGDQIAYNFFYIDEALGYLLSQNIRPYIELSFMPSALAAGNQKLFAYQADISMTKSCEQWKDMVSELLRHLLEQFGRIEVEQWFFEVWNEPDIDEFWAGEFEDYLQLYLVSYNAIKQIDTALRVGGPAASSVIFQTQKKMRVFLDFCTENHVMPDFLSAHPYPAQFYEISGSFAQLQKMCPASYTIDNIQWLREVAKDAGYPKIELHMNEWNASPRYDDYVHDTAFMATYVIDTALRCADLCAVLGWWTVSDLFDEGGVVYREFGGGFGLINRSGLKKPAYWGMWALRRLCANVLEKGEDYIVTTEGNRFAVLLWNHAFYLPAFAKGERSQLSYYDRYRVFEPAGVKRFLVTIAGLAPCTVSVLKHQFDQKHGSIYEFWMEHGAIEYLKDDFLALHQQNNHIKTETRFLTVASKLTLEADVRRFGFTLFEVNVVG